MAIRHETMYLESKKLMVEIGEAKASGGVKRKFPWKAKGKSVKSIEARKPKAESNFYHCGGKKDTLLEITRIQMERNSSFVKEWGTFKKIVR